MVDMHTIGAGGGSIAKLDSGGMLQVGPESAGAAPGPACYAKGGVLPTVTDANFVLGRIPEECRLGGYLPLNKPLAEKSIARLAADMNISLEDAAFGIIEIANEHMARARRVIPVQTGYDPNYFPLVSWGGAGGLHVCALAEKLEMQRVLIPVYAGVRSALGMLATRPGRQLSHTHVCRLAEMDEGGLEKEFEKLRTLGIKALTAECVTEQTITAKFSLDLRYQGQSNTLNIVWEGLVACEQAFHTMHQQRYGHQLDIAVELVNIRAGIHGEGLELSLKQENISGLKLGDVDYSCGVPVYQRENLPVGYKISGPAIVAETVATTWLAENWVCEKDQAGNLLLQRE